MKRAPVCLVWGLGISLCLWTNAAAQSQETQPKPEGSAPPVASSAKDEPKPQVNFDAGLLAKLVVPRPVDPLAGNDPVSLTESQSLAPGQKDLQAIFDGQTYLFTTEENRNRFLENPARFVPALAGHSIVSYKAMPGHWVPGSLDARSLYFNRVYLFATADEKAKFDADPAAFEEADLVLQGSSPVSLVDEEVVKRGDKEFETVFEGRRVRFASAVEQERFLAAPESYFPALGGLDPVSVADGSPQFGFARYSALYKNRLYAMSSAENRDRFLANPQPHADLDVADGGRDPVLLVEDRADRAGHYAISTLYRGQRFLFASEGNRTKFLEDAPRYYQERSANRLK